LILIACTELSILGCHLPFDMIDAAEILAREIVAVAKNEYDEI
jgi:aspartate/glutamate racemase